MNIAATAVRDQRFCMSLPTVDRQV